MPTLDDLEDLLRKGKNDEAFELIKKDKGLTAQNLIEEGNFFSINEEYDLSFSYFDLAEKFAEDDNTKKLAWGNLGVAYNKRGVDYCILEQYKEAIDDFTLVIDLNPQDAEAYQNRGNAYSALKQYKEAIDDFTLAIDLNKKAIIDIIVEIKLNPELIDDIILTIQLNRNLSYLYNHRGDAYSALNQHERAIEDYILALESRNLSKKALKKQRNACTTLYPHEKAIEEINNIRCQFEKEVKSIIGIEPERLSRDFFRKCRNLNDCNNCERKFLVKEKGLTKENISIYLRFIRIFGGGSYSYCIGTDVDGFVLCYDRNMIPIITRIHKAIFSQISTLAYTLSVCQTRKQNYVSMIRKAKKKITKFWNIIDNGVLALNGAYRRTKFKNSKDILNITLSQDELVLLHGHQSKDFLRGQRPEQNHPIKYPDESISVVKMGHFHQLGVFSVNGFVGLVCLTGHNLFPERGYFSEMLSQMGTIEMLTDGSELRFVINRKKISNEKIKHNLEKFRENPWTFNMKINIFRKLCSSYTLFLPGNHDPFDEVYIKKDINGKEDLGEF